MISEDSIFRRLPIGISKKQLVIYDGIRHSAEIITVAYSRLEKRLTEIAMSGQKRVDWTTLAEVYIDLWAIIDSIDRFRQLWKSDPGYIEDRENDLRRSFIKETDSVRRLRNAADHLGARSDHIVSVAGSSLGEVSWITKIHPKGDEGYLCAILPGNIHNRKFETTKMVVSNNEHPTTMIRLSLGKDRAYLSAAINSMRICIARIEKALVENVQRQKINAVSNGADILIRQKFIRDSEVGVFNLEKA